MIEIALASCPENCLFIFFIMVNKTKSNKTKKLEDMDIQETRWDQEN